MTPAEARNIASKDAKGRFLLFLDDDVTLPSTYLKLSEQYLVANKIDILGGPDRTPKDANIFEEALGMALSSPLATASTRYRHTGAKDTIKASEKNLILCALWIRKDLFSSHLFDHRFFRNEENVLIDQLTNYKIVYDQELWVFHKRKAHPLHLVKAVAGSGYYRMKSFHLFANVQPLYLVPALFVIYLFCSLISFKGPMILYPLIVYLGLNFLTSFYLSMRKIYLFPIVMGYQLLINLSYGIGTLIYIVKAIKWRGKATSLNKDQLTD